MRSSLSVRRGAGITRIASSLQASRVTQTWRRNNIIIINNNERSALAHIKHQTAAAYRISIFQIAS